MIFKKVNKELGDFLIMIFKNFHILLGLEGWSLTAIQRVSPPLPWTKMAYLYCKTDDFWTISFLHFIFDFDYELVFCKMHKFI